MKTELRQKGGTGKTTLALNLAAASENAGKPAVIVDLDPQASAKSWHSGRHGPIDIFPHLPPPLY